MKIGAENKKRVALMAVLLAVAVLLAINSFRLLNNSRVSVQQAANAFGTTQQKTSKIRGATSDPTLHAQNLIVAERTDYNGARRNIFVDELPAQSRNITQKPPTGSEIHFEAPPPPVNPPIPLTFYGFATQFGKPKKAFLQGTAIFIAGEGDVVDRRYRILKITNQFVLVEDVLNSNQQTISLTPPQAG